MLRKIFFFISLFLIIVFQVFFVGNIFSASSAPNLILLLIIFWTVKMGFERTLKIVIFSGIILDVFYFWPIGVNVLSLAAVSFLTSFLSKRFLTRDFFSRSFWVVIIISVCVLLNDFLNQATFYILHFFQKTSSGDFSLRWQIWQKIVLNLVVFSIIYWPLKKMETLISFYGPKKEPKYYVK